MNKRSRASFEIGASIGDADFALVLLHPYCMKAEDMLEIAEGIFQKVPCVRIFIPDSSHNSWFHYLTDYEGLKEDIVDTQSLARSRHAIRRLLWQIRELIPRVCIAGVSQGGSLALDVATVETVEAVVTVGSIPIYPSRYKQLKAPWFALHASHDEIFPSSWCLAFYDRAHMLREVKTTHGELFHSTALFVADILSNVI